MKRNFMVVNRDNRPTFVNAARKQCLDVTLATCNISEQIHSWRVTDEETNSDHKLIKFNLRGYFPTMKPFRNPRKTNWEMYRSLLEEKLKELDYSERYLTAEHIDHANHVCTKAMVEAFEEACPAHS